MYMLFPETPEYLDEKNRPILKQMEKFYSEAITINQSFWSEAETDTRFESGDQTIWNDIYGNLPAHQRRQFSFNRIKRVVNMISGHQRRNRKSTIVTPIENSDQETADQFSQVLMWANRQDGVLEAISDAFHGSLVTGMNLLQVWVDYRSDPVSGNIRVENCPYNSFLIDPYFKKSDLSDCNGLWKRKYLTKQECRSLLPGKEKEIESLSPQDSNRDGKFQYLPENYSSGMRNLLAYDEFYYRAYRKQKMLIDSETGETMEWKGSDESLKKFLSIYPQVTAEDSEVPTVNLAIVVQGHVMHNDINPYGLDVYPFVPVLAYYNPQMPYYPWRIQGVVRNLRDAQYLYNRRKVIELDILESQVNSGYIYKEDALVNPKDVFSTGQGKGIALKSTAQMTDVQPIQSPQVPPTTIELSRALGEEINQISGVNEELLGSATDDKAGILSQLRQGAGLTTLQSLFDQLDYSQKLLGKIMISIVQNNFSEGKVKRIIEGEPSPQFYNKNFGRYDAAIEEGLNTTTQKQMQFAQLLQLREVGVPVPDEQLLESCTLQNKKELTDAVAQAAQQKQQLEQMQNQIQMRELEARANLADARAEADRGLAIERTSRVEENQAMAVEKIAEAQKDRMSGVLDIVRALKELESIDIGQIETLLNLSQILKSQEQQAKAEVEQEGQQEELKQAIKSEARSSSPQTQAPQQEVLAG